MTKNLFLRLCLMMAVIVLQACRTDQFPEKESYSEGDKFQLTSKRISLKESKHKSNLLPELEISKPKLKAHLKASSKNGSANLSDNFTIDTENVIYIENGPNYHTYTFNIHRNEGSEDAPVENLVLSPLTDGTYRKLLVSYNLSPQERLALENGESVDTEGKTTISDIGKETLTQVLGKSNANCQWITTTAYTPCSENKHFNGQGSNICSAAIKSQQITVTLFVCNDQDNGDANPTGPGGSGTEPGGGADGGGETPEPCDDTGVLTSPQTPDFDVSDGGCGDGIPTQPNVPIVPTDPCEKTKAMLQKPEVQSKLDSLRDKSVTNGEDGFKIKSDGTASNIIHGGKHHIDLGPKAGNRGGYHNHTATGTSMLSPPDIHNNLLPFAYAQPTGFHQNAFMGMIKKKACSSCPNGYRIYHYIAYFNGTYSDALTSYTEEQEKGFIKDYKKLVQQMEDIYGPYGTSYQDSNGEMSFEGLEVLFFNMIEKMGLADKVILQRLDENDNHTIYNINLNSDKLHTTPTPCL